MDDKSVQVEPASTSSPTTAAKKPTPAARRALEEAAARRLAAANAPLSPEFNGRGGLEPVRYGDWEVKGLASDF